MKIGLFLDISNLYHGGREKYKKKINYSKYLDFVKTLGPVKIARAYGTAYKGDAGNFISSLKKAGYTPIFKELRVYKRKRKGDVDTHMVVDILNLCDQFDTLVLGSADSDFLPVVRALLQRDKKVIILACTVSKALRQAATSAMEVHEGLMEENSAATKTKRP